MKTNDNMFKFEVMDRSAVILMNADQTLTDHAGLTKKTRKKLSKAIRALGELYQAAANEFYESAQYEEVN